MVQIGLPKCSDSSKIEFQRLVETQAMLVLSICAGGEKKQIDKAHRVVNEMWDSVQFSWELYAEAVLKLEPSAHSLIFGSYFLKFLQKRKQTDLINKCKVGVELCLLIYC